MAGIKMSERNMSEFEKDVRKSLIDRGMSMTDLARALSISNAYVYDIMSGRRNANDMKQKMIHFLGLDGDKYV